MGTFFGKNDHFKWVGVSRLKLHSPHPNLSISPSPGLCQFIAAIKSSMKVLVSEDESTQASLFGNIWREVENSTL